MYKDELKIRQLIERYMDGKTTIEEEDLLSDWFATHPDVSEDLKDYQMMFTLLGSERIQHMEVESTRQNAHKRLRPLWLSLSVAASLALAFLVFHPRTTEQSAPLAQTAIAQAEEKPVSTTTDSTKIETEYSSPSTPAPKKSIREQRFYHKHQFDIAPPTKELAAATQPDTRQAENVPPQDMGTLDIQPDDIIEKADHVLAQTEQTIRQTEVPDIDGMATKSLDATVQEGDKILAKLLEDLYAQQEEMKNLLKGDKDAQHYTSHETDGDVY